MLTLWLTTGLLGGAAEARGLSGKPVRARRGRVGRLDEEYRQQLVAEQQARIAAQIRAMPPPEPVEPDYAKLADLQAQMSMLRATMATIEFLERRAAHQAQAEREAAQMRIAIAAYAEALRVADEIDEEDAIEAFLLAA